MPARKRIVEWPPRPAKFPDMMEALEACMYLRLDRAKPESALRTLRNLRKRDGLPCCGRVGSNLYFRKEAIDEWLGQREAAQRVRVVSA